TPGSLVDKPAGTTIKLVTRKSNSPSAPPRNSPTPKNVSSPRSKDSLVKSVQRTKKEEPLGTAEQGLPKKRTQIAVEAKKKQVPSVHKKKQTGISSGLSVIVTQKSKSSHKGKPHAKQAKNPKKTVPSDEKKPMADTGKDSGGWWSTLGS
ncbi:16355_t:CDS:1, partial [Acaulospora colombiana]